MAQPNAYVQVPPDSTGKKLATFSFVVGADTVHAHGQVLVDSAGNEIAPATAGNQASELALLTAIDGDTSRIPSSPAREDGNLQALVEFERNRLREAIELRR